MQPRRANLAQPKLPRFCCFSRACVCLSVPPATNFPQAACKACRDLKEIVTQKQVRTYAEEKRINSDFPGRKYVISAKMDSVNSPRKSGHTFSVLKLS